MTTPEPNSPSVMTLSPEQLQELADLIARQLPTWLIYRDPPTVPVGSVPEPETPAGFPSATTSVLPPPPPGVPPNVLAQIAGDPGPAAELAPSTGRSAAEGIPDTVIETDPERDPDPGGAV